MAAVAQNLTENGHVYTSVDLARAFDKLMEWTCVSHTHLCALFFRFLQAPRNFRGFGFQVDLVWSVSNVDLAEIINKNSSTTGSNYKDRWLAYGLVTINDLTYEESVYEHNGGVWKDGSIQAHRVRLSDGLLKLLAKLKAGDELTEEDFDPFMQSRSYGSRNQQTRIKNTINAEKSHARKRHKLQGTAVPEDHQYLSTDEKKARQFRRPEEYRKRLRKTKQPTKHQRLLMKSWKHSFNQDLNNLDLEEALRRLKKVMKEAGQTREEYIIPALNIIKRRGGTDNDQYFSVNYIYNKALMDIYESVYDRRPSASDDLMKFRDIMTGANLPKTVISGALSYWLTKLECPRRDKDYISHTVTKHLDVPCEILEELHEAPAAAPQEFADVLDFSDLEAGIPDI